MHIITCSIIVCTIALSFLLPVSEMELNQAFGQALKHARISRNLTQEDFTTVSSRTYISALERGLQSPTLEKVDELCGVLEAHPASLVAAAYLMKEGLTVDQLLATITSELKTLGLESSESYLSSNPNSYETDPT